MTIIVTVQDVRDLVPDLQATDQAIDTFNNVVGCKVDSCLESNYSNCLDLAKAIKIYTIAYFADKSNNNNGATTSRKWADGDAETYANKEVGTNFYWDTVLQLDSAGCVSSAFKTNKVFAVTGRTSKYYGSAQ